VTKHTRPKLNSWIIIFWFYPIEQFWLNPEIWFNLKVLYTTSDLSSIISIFKLTNIKQSFSTNHSSPCLFSVVSLSQVARVQYSNCVRTWISMRETTGNWFEKIMMTMWFWGNHHDFEEHATTVSNLGPCLKNSFCAI